MSRVVDRNGVFLTRNQRVEDEQGRTGKVVATVGRTTALVKFDDADDDTYVDAGTLTTIDVIFETRRRKP